VATGNTAVDLAIDGLQVLANTEVADSVFQIVRDNLSTDRG
jgi:hypothetical protein